MTATNPVASLQPHLDLKAPLLRVGGAGDIDIGNSALNYTVKASVVATAKGQGGKGLEQLSGLTVPVKLTGPFDGIQYKVDYGAAAAELAKSKVGEKVKEGLDKNKGKLAPKVHQVPVEVEQFVALHKLSSMGISIDELTAEQKRYMTGWEQGT